MSNSIATLTTINSPVALNALVSPLPPIIPNIKLGTKAINAKKVAPNRVILFEIFFKYSAVGFPGRIPGINPPFC